MTGISPEKAKGLCERYAKLKGDRAPWDTAWQEIADYMMPRKAGITSAEYTPNSSKESRLFDTTAADGLQTMASGLMSWRVSTQHPWFSFGPDLQQRGSDKVKNWLQDCTDLAREYLAKSNFYTETHEDYLNHIAFGTSCLFLEGDEPKYGGVNFRSMANGTYCVEEDSRGRANGFWREFILTAQQAVEMFGQENVGEKIAKAAGGDGAKPVDKFTFLHHVCRRPDESRSPQKLDSLNKPWMSCYVEMGEKKLVREAGYDDFPFAVGRYLRWEGMGDPTPYGYSPGFAALPDQRQLNFLQCMMDVLAEKEAFPPIIAPDDLEGELYMSARGITYFNSSLEKDKFPRRLIEPGRYDIGKDRVEMRRQVLETKFHVDLFRMFAQLDKQMTAREVAERAGEKLDLFSPAATRLEQEKDTPILLRCFKLWMSAGMLPQPPDEAIIPASEFIGFIPDPKIEFTSRLALAVKARHLAGFERQLERTLVIAQSRPEVLDNYNWDRIERDTARTHGLPSEWLADEEAVAASRQARAKMAEQERQMMMAQGGADAASKLGRVPKDSAVGKMIEAQAA